MSPQEHASHGGHARSAGASCASSALGAAAGHPGKLNAMADYTRRPMSVCAKIGSRGSMRSSCSWAPYRQTPTCSLCVSLSVCTFRGHERAAFLCAASFEARSPQLTDNCRRRSAAATLDIGIKHVRGQKFCGGCNLAVTSQEPRDITLLYLQDEAASETPPVMSSRPLSWNTGDLGL